MNLHSLHAKGRGIPLTETQQLDAGNLLTQILNYPGPSRAILGYFKIKLKFKPLQSEIY